MQHFLLATRALFVALLLLLPLGACPASGVGERGAGAATDVEKNADANAAKVAITASQRERGREWERERGSSKSVASVANVAAAVGQHHFGPQHSIVCASSLLSSLLAKQRCLYTLHSSHAYLAPSLSLTHSAQCCQTKLEQALGLPPLPPTPVKAAPLL